MTHFGRWVSNSCRLAGLIVAAGCCSAQSIEIKLPPGVNSETLFVRYVLAGQDFGGWVQPLSGVSSYVIGTALRNRPATRIRAIVYAPGCAVRTLDLPLTGSDNPPWSFVCKPVRTISIEGALSRCDRFYGHSVTVQARYVARWAAKFLGLDDLLVTTIPIGVTHLSPEGRFSLTIPDVAQDHPGEIQIWAKDGASSAILGRLTPVSPLQIRSRTVYAIENPPQMHDKFGFALRMNAGNDCDP